MSMEAMIWALAQQSLEPVDKFVLLCMCDGAQENCATVADASIARYTNLPECEVPHVIDRLVRLGFVLRHSLGKYILAMHVAAPIARTYRKKVIGSRLRLTVFERDGYACLRCKSQKNLRADHVLAESEGGEAVLENLQTLCATCNSWKGTKTIDFRGLPRASA
ncbi:HNH endonuclease [Pseudomonas sp. 681]|uniref:HNH endonuclease n=1 Tax=Pseudomonas fungipugnans TaxID=3024217 RepID=A0ABT6QUX1_9PSED|nr:HNH endonuclease [Pseudomonas sp. 681]MDI2594089.1 HNH endonuclease [Pseudomonas sp. 681]